MQIRYLDRAGNKKDLNKITVTHTEMNDYRRIWVVIRTNVPDKGKNILSEITKWLDSFLASTNG